MEWWITNCILFTVSHNFSSLLQIVDSNVNAHSNAMVKSDIHKLLPYSIHISMSVTITDIFNDPAKDHRFILIVQT